MVFSDLSLLVLLKNNILMQFGMIFSYLCNLTITLGLTGFDSKTNG